MTARKVNQRQAVACIAARETFQASALSGRMVKLDRCETYGSLPAEYCQQLRTSLADGPAYVVFSYQTPIAWVTSAGEVAVPAVRYSVTTSGHQYKVRQALAARYEPTTRAVPVGAYGSRAGW